MISDIVTNDLPEQLRNNLMTWAGCLGGAIEESDYLQLVRDAGFTDVKVVDKMIYESSMIESALNSECACSSCDVDLKELKDYTGKVASIKLSARKPG